MNNQKNEHKKITSLELQCFVVERITIVKCLQLETDNCVYENHVQKTKSCNYTSPADPHYLNLPNNSRTLESSSVFLMSVQGYFTFLYQHTKYTTEVREKGRTNTHRLGLAPSARGKILWHFCAALSAFAGYRRREFARNSHKATRNAD